jgi:hypothetical protein
LLAWGGLYVVLGSKAVYDHEWVWLLLTPGLAVSSALLIDWMVHRCEEVSAGTVAGWIVVTGGALFAVWTGHTTFRELSPLGRDDPFTPMELAQAIRAAAPGSGDVAMLVGGEEADAQLWFYGDRPLRTRIWTIQEFERRLNDTGVDLVYDFDQQPWTGAATGIVFPKHWAVDLRRFRAYVDERYPRSPLPGSIADKFDVFDLRPRPDALRPPAPGNRSERAAH